MPLGLARVFAAPKHLGAFPDFLLLELSQLAPQNRATLNQQISNKEKTVPRGSDLLPWPSVAPDSLPTKKKQNPYSITPRRRFIQQTPPAISDLRPQRLPTRFRINPCGLSPRRLFFGAAFFAAFCVRPTGEAFAFISFLTPHLSGRRRGITQPRATYRQDNISRRSRRVFSNCLRGEARKICPAWAWRGEIVF